MSTSAVVLIYGQELESGAKHILENVYTSIDGCPDSMLRGFCLALVDVQKKCDKYNTFRRELGDDSNLKNINNSVNALTNFIIAHIDGEYSRNTVAAIVNKVLSEPLVEKDINELMYDLDADWVFFFDLVNSILYISKDSDFDSRKAIYCSPIEYVQCLDEECQESTEQQMREHMKEIESYGLKLAI